MATPTTLKKKEEEDFRKIVNDWLARAMLSTGGFNPEVMKQYETAGLESLKRKAGQEGQKTAQETSKKQPLEAVVVSKNKKGMVPVSKAGPGEVTVTQVARMISPDMTMEAIAMTEALGDRIKAAETPGQLDFRKWVKRG
ncbi:hypothetical protein H0O00_01180 [Candidatus Micrarchaeota archaeon]|nr:hypothetical protein [Candidatus Micrarchaeota archaeon]